MAIHIGHIIQAKAEEKKFSQQRLGDLINTTKQNVGDIYTRQNIDTGLLLKLCVALEHDFFHYFYQDETLNELSRREIERLQKNIGTLQDTVERQNTDLIKANELISTLKELTFNQRQNISFMEKEAGYEMQPFSKDAPLAVGMPEHPIMPDPSPIKKTTRHKQENTTSNKKKK